METISELVSRYAQPGRLEWIGIRPDRRTEMISRNTAMITDYGLEGDHNQTGGKRALTLIQQEHLPVIAALAGHLHTDPAMLRRNLLISRINLLGLRQRRFRIGDAILEGTGICAPCSRMEEALGNGGYAAVRGHGGITARIIQAGKIATGCDLEPC